MEPTILNTSASEDYTKFTGRLKDYTTPTWSDIPEEVRKNKLFYDIEISGNAVPASTLNNIFGSQQLTEHTKFLEEENKKLKQQVEDLQFIVNDLMPKLLGKKDDGPAD